MGYIYYTSKMYWNFSTASYISDNVNEKKKGLHYVLKISGGGWVHIYEEHTDSQQSRDNFRLNNST